MKLTQVNKILTELKAAGDSGLHPTYFIETLHIYQYGARISDLRVLMGCSCHHAHRCPGLQHIVNKTMPDGTTRFYYVDDNIQITKTLREAQEEFQKPKPGESLNLFSV